MGFLKILEIILFIIIFIIAVGMTVIGLVLFELLTYIHQAEIPAWLEIGLFLIAPYFLFRLSYFFISRYKYIAYYG